MGDIRDLKDVAAAMDGVDSVIHVAGLVSFGTFPDVVSMEEINVDGESFSSCPRFRLCLYKRSNSSSIA